MVRLLGQMLAAIKLSALLLVIFLSLIVAAGALLLGYGGVWLLIPLGLVAILTLGMVAGVNNDIEGLICYLELHKKQKPAHWNDLVKGSLHSLENNFIEAFKAQARINAEYKDAVKEMSHSSSELARNARDVSKGAAHQSSAMTSRYISCITCKF